MVERPLQPAESEGDHYRQQREREVERPLQRERGRETITDRRENILNIEGEGALTLPLSSIK